VNALQAGKLVVVVGTNASGKSSLAVDLAEFFKGEIVSADSRQVYRGLDIGAGKLAREEMRNVPHHLLDVAELDSIFSLAEYQGLAYSAIDDILNRQRTPFLVGGTGLYVRAVTQGYNLIDVPPNYTLRNKLEQETGNDLWMRLSSVDPDAAKLISPKNKRRVVRALELYLNGRRYSEQLQSKPRYDSLQLGLTWPPDVLRERIMARLIKRMDEGMVDEAKKLLSSGVRPEKLDALGLEYRHLLRYIEGTYKTEAELIERLSTHIYQFSRKQILWFRRDTNIKWLNSEGNYRAEAVELVSEYLNS